MKLIGYNYPEITSDPEMEVLVNHMVEWEPFCKILNPEYFKLAEILKEVKGLKIASFNTELN